MKSTIFSLFLAVFALVHTVSADVTTLTNDNFYENVSKGKWFVMFYAPWCGHCKRLKPTWSELADEENKNFNVGMVDCTKEVEIAKMFQIRSYPTLYFIENENMSKYEGSRAKQNFMDYANGHTFTEENTKPNPSFGMAPKKVSFMDKFKKEAKATYTQVQEMNNKYPMAFTMFSVFVFITGFVFGQFSTRMAKMMFGSETTHSQTATSTGRKGTKKD